MITEKQIKGQYFTKVNPFIGGAWNIWNSERPEGVVLEPFAGAGDLFKYVEADWVGYDIDPQHPLVQERDTIADFPAGYRTCITNPPYLAKNAAARKKIDIDLKHEDLYLDCLEKCLDNCGWVAAIIPATFYRTGLFSDRLLAWDKIDYQLFDDTDAPVGVAYFTPKYSDTKLYVNGEEINDNLPDKKVDLKFNVAEGTYVMCGIDKTSGDSIEIRKDGAWFDRSKYLKHTSRNYVLFSSSVEIDIDATNNNINRWRSETKDFYLTPFKSMQKSGKYRKRMGFGELERLIVIK
jgi:hypothetical protein